MRGRAALAWQAGNGCHMMPALAASHLVGTSSEQLPPLLFLPCFQLGVLHPTLSLLSCALQLCGGA